MSQAMTYPDLDVTLEGHVATVEIRRPPHNFFDTALISTIADAFEELDRQTTCRAIVLAAQGRSFCAGADLSNPPSVPDRDPSRPPPPHLYKEAARLFRATKPVIAAVHGAAIGGGLGLALVADFRVTCTRARFAANFNRLGFHPGFGLTVTLPRLVGQQRAAWLFYTGRRICGDEAVAMGLADLLVGETEVRTRGRPWRRRSPNPRRLPCSRPERRYAAVWSRRSRPQPNVNSSSNNGNAGQRISGKA